MGENRAQTLGGAITTAEEVSSGLATFIQALRKSWAIILAVLIVSVGIGLLYTRSLARVFQATAMMEFDPNIIQPLANKADPMMGYSSYWDNREYYETQFRIITSERVLAQVARDLGLLTDPHYGGGATPAREEDVANALRGQIVVEPVKNTRLVLIKVEDTDPARARRICESVATTYINQNFEIKINQTSDAVVWLSGQIDLLKKELESHENALHRFKKENELPSTSINEASNMIRMEMTAYDEALTKTRTRKQELLARHSELSKVSSESADQLPASELLNNSFLGRLRESYLRAVEEKNALVAEGKGENHPLVKAADQKLQSTQAALLNEVRNIKGAVARDLAVMARQEGGESGLYEAARRRAVDLNMKEIEYRRLDRARDQNEKLYAMLVERMKEAELARNMKGNNIRLVDTPQEPKGPIRPRPLVNTIISVVAGLLIGIAFAWLREQLDNTVKLPEDVEQKLGITFIGLLPEHDDRGELRSKRYGRRKGSKRRPSVLAGELVVHEHPLSAIGEAARSVRTNLMFMNPDHPHRRILVTSAAPGEGKTTVACSIAIAMAQSGQRTLIIDCDLRRPRLHRLFDRAGDVGLTNLLVGDATLDEVAKPTIVKNLWCIPAGPIPPNPADMLHSARFKKFLAEVSDKFDRIIIDSPPIVAVTDAAIVSTLVDTTVFVIRAFKTTLTLSRQGLRALLDVDAPVAGAVLNAVDFNRLEYNYYYGYGYYHHREKYAYGAQRLAARDGTDEKSEEASPPN